MTYKYLVFWCHIEHRKSHLVHSFIVDKELDSRLWLQHTGRTKEDVLITIEQGFLEQGVNDMAFWNSGAEWVISKKQNVPGWARTTILSVNSRTR